MNKEKFGKSIEPITIADAQRIHDIGVIRSHCV